MNGVFLKVAVCGLLLSAYASAASFDCAKAASATEKLICGNEAVSALDEQLGQAYKEALANTSEKDALKQQQMAWLKEQRACKSAECLTQTYQARIAQLQKGEVAIASAPAAQTVPAAIKTLAKKATFKITFGQGEPLCEEYLKVLNRTAWDDLQSCKLPDLTGSPIQQVKFNAVSADMLNTLDQIIFEQSGGRHFVSWDVAQLTRKKQYDTGYRTLGVINWDLNKDGTDDLIVESREPMRTCEPFNEKLSSGVGGQADIRWNSFADDERVALSKKYGFARFYFLINNKKLYFTPIENLVNFSGSYFSISHANLSFKDKFKKAADGDLIYISSVNPEKQAKGSAYKAYPADCKFSLN